MSDPENRTLLSATPKTEQLLLQEVIDELALDLVIGELRILVEKIQHLWTCHDKAELEVRAGIACSLFDENEKLQQVYKSLSIAEKRHIQSIDPNFYEALDLEAKVMKPHLSKVLGYTQP